METPNGLDAVLAEITHQNSLGKNGWYEVVYYDGAGWASYHGSDTFSNGEQVLKWRYVGECFS